MSQLTDHQIHIIEEKVKEGLNASQIATCLGKNRSVIARLFQKYPQNAFIADVVIQDRFKTKSQATQSHRRIKPGGSLDQYIHEKFMLDWSPEQIAESWKTEQKQTEQKQTEQMEPQKQVYKEETNGTETRNKDSNGNTNTDRKIHLSKDTIYDWIYLKYDPKVLKKHLRRKNKAYRDRKKEAALGGKYQIADRVMIDERSKKYPSTEIRHPITKERTEEVGHWEGDTIIGKNRSGAILTLVERKTGLTLIAELPLGKKAEGVTSALARLMNHIPKDQIKSITFDNGREFADHKMMQFELKQILQKDVDIYFAHPYHSWERGTNENTNGLIRQYIPKKTDFKNITQKDLDKIQILLNSRPRKRLYYATPNQVFWGTEKCCVSE